MPPCQNLPPLLPVIRLESLDIFQVNLKNALLTKDNEKNTREQK